MGQSMVNILVLGCESWVCSCLVAVMGTIESRGIPGVIKSTFQK